MNVADQLKTEKPNKRVGKAFKECLRYWYKIHGHVGIVDFQFVDGSHLTMRIYDLGDGDFEFL